MKPAVGVIGLGIMGSAMAANLARAGFAVYGYDMSLRPDRHPLPLAEEVASKAHHHHVASQCGSIACGFKRAERRNRHRDQHAADRGQAESAGGGGKDVLDCPLSGTGAQARTRDLVVYASGDEKASRNRSGSERFLARALLPGEFGNGSKMKFVAICWWRSTTCRPRRRSCSGMRAGLDPRTIYRVIGDGAGHSRMFQVRGPQMVAGRYDGATMKNEVWQKDMKIIGEFATRLGVPTPSSTPRRGLHRGDGAGIREAGHRRGVRGA